MNTDIHARGFTLTPALRDTVERQAEDLRQRLPRRIGALSVRLFDVNGTRGGIDKGCLVHARLERHGTVVVATEVDSDLYRAIGAAFAKLQRGVRAALDRGRTTRRVPPRRRRADLTTASSAPVLRPMPGVAVIAIPS